MREEGKGKTHEDAQGGTKKQVRNQTIRHAHYVSETESQNLDNQNWDMLMIMFIPRDVCTKPNSNQTNFINDVDGVLEPLPFLYPIP